METTTLGKAKPEIRETETYEAVRELIVLGERGTW